MARAIHKRSTTRGRNRPGEQRLPGAGAGNPICGALPRHRPIGTEQQERSPQPTNHHNGQGDAA
jgi:hypothetical protein